MTTEEKALALRLYEKAMENTELLVNNTLYAALCVEAAKEIYAVIGARDKTDFDEESKRLEAEKAAFEERKAADKAKRKAALGEPQYYLCYTKRKTYVDINVDLRIRTRIGDVSNVISDSFNKYMSDTYVEVALYKISKEESDGLLHKHKHPNTTDRQKVLSCASTEDFIQYLIECPSAERIDIPDYRIGNAKVL